MLRAQVERLPEDPSVLNEVAWEMLTVLPESLVDPAEPIRLAETACDLTQWEDPEILDTLAVAYFEAGDLEKAIATQKRAVELPAAGGNPSYLETLRRYEEARAGGR